jgi:hypothetical protein
MTECIWERGDRNLLHIRSADCFRAIEELKLPLSEGELIQAKLKLEVIGKSTRPVTVTIRVPSRIEFSKKTHEHVVDQFLSKAGIRNVSPGLKRIDLWSLHPWRQPLSVWHSLFGREADLLIERQVLRPIQLGAVPHPDHAGAGRVLEAHAMPGGDFYGVSQSAEIPSRSLSTTDLDGWELDPERFRTHLRTELRISVAGTAWDGQDLLDLGTVDLGGQRLHISYALRQPAQGFGDRLRAKAAGAPSVLLIPSSQYEGSEMPKVILDSPLPRRPQVIRSAIAACGLRDSLPAVYSAEDGVRLVVDTRHGKVWIDQVEILELQCGTHPFNFVTLLARARGPVAIEEISEKLSPGRQDGTSAARQAKGEAKKIICDAMAAVGRTFAEDPFPSAGTGYYRCALASYVV